MPTDLPKRSVSVYRDFVLLLGWIATLVDLHQEITAVVFYFARELPCDFETNRKSAKLAYFLISIFQLLNLQVRNRPSVTKDQLRLQRKQKPADISKALIL